jgi:hypothetical protein
MGSALSTSRGITREQLLKSTADSRDFTNKLFNIMLSKITPEDLMKLSKSQMCSSYVFMMADSIGKLFEDLRIRPKKDRDSGVVFFQKVDTLRASTGESRQLCLIISYYYVRIFQIFGALAMTVLDDPSAGAVLGVLQYRPQGAPAVPRAPGARGAMLGGHRNEMQQGGADERYFVQGSIMAKFKPIRHLLGDREQLLIGREAARNAFQFVESPELALIPDRSDGNLYLNIGNDTFITAKMDMGTMGRRSEGTIQLPVILSNIKYKDSSMDATQLTKINAYLKAKIGNVSIKFISLDQISWVKDDVGLTETLVYNLQRAYKNVQKYIENPELYQAQVDVYGRAVARLPGAPGAGSDVGVPRVLYNQYIIQTLKGIAGSKTTSFCVARALQLLDANSLYQPRPTEGISGVCMARFDALPISVPEAKKPISQVPGLKALDQLYYVNPHLGPKDETLFDKVEDYAAFLTTMTGLFGTQGVKTSTSIDTILAKDPNCPGNAAKHYLRIQDPEKIKKIMVIIQQLFNKQLEHTKKVIHFFKNTMFIIKNRSPEGAIGKYIELHPNLLRGGLEDVAKLSRAARQILVDYYKGCEDLYQKGVQEVLGSKYSVV